MIDIALAVRNLATYTLTSLLFLSANAIAGDYVWKAAYTNNYWSTTDSYPTPYQACQAFTRSLPGISAYVADIPPRYLAENNFQCQWQHKVTGQISDASSNSWRLGTGCDGFYDNITGQCLPTEEDECECDTFNVFGNSINPATGNNTQREQDYIFDNGLIAERHYNSKDGKWRHAYSTELKVTGETALLIKANGKVSRFAINGGNGYGYGAERGRLLATATGWTYTSAKNDKFFFSQDGKLTGTQASGRLKFEIARENANLRITDPYNGSQLVIEQDTWGQPKKISSGTTTLTYQYNNRNMLSKVIKSAGGVSSERQYFYEDNSSKSLLTKIIDEKNNEAAKFTYLDNKVSSAVFGGTNSNTYTYSGNKTRIKNTLGKYTSFNTESINGINRVVAIEGEPTLNCPTTKSSCKYNSRGLLESRTDNLGRKTIFEHNDYGFEISRTEAVGTPKERTITTEWHPTLPLPNKIEDPDRIITYQYDDEGRRLSETISEK